ncbi:MAG: rhodanese-like domain-containing protein [Chloroflexota bacterium]
MTRFKFKWQILILALSLGLAGCGGQAQAPAAPPAAVEAQPPALQNLPLSIDAATVEQLRQRNDVFILDVREVDEFNSSHIPGATLLPLGQIPDRLDEVPRDKTVIAVCRSGNRSGQAADFLRQQGFDNVHNMEGGMNAWSQAGYQTEQ